MLSYKEYKGHKPDVIGTRKKIDNTIYTFDIETTSYLILHEKQLNTMEYLKLTDDEREDCFFNGEMYIWMLGINDIVYYGRTWEELSWLLVRIDMYSPYKKIIFIHNLSFEFQFLINHYKFINVFARKSHNVIKCEMKDFNFELRCSYMMSGVKLEYLPKIYNLPVEKQVGDLDYSKIRHSKTYLTKAELRYCEYDCLVVYHYIKKELEIYEKVNKIPITSTGHVRRELKDIVMKDWNYKNRIRKAVNTNPHIYNLLLECFMGGYVKSNWIYTDEIIKNVTSFDFTSSYPYVMTTYRYPSSQFLKCNIKKKENMSKNFAYILVVRFTDLKCKYYNNFISQSKCRNIKNGRYDNGRVISADSLEITLTDIDFYFITKVYKCKYEIIESYYSKYDFLPKQFIDFILQKYVNKTKYKNVSGKEVEYALEKGKFNSLYGMCVTNNIKDEVIFDNIEGWNERELTNDEIINALQDEKDKAFLSFAYGVWVTAHARNNLLENLIQLDEYAIYCDTDCIKLKEGFDIKVINNYNKSVVNRIEKVCKILEIDKSMFEPVDSKGIKHMMGLFEKDEVYDRFITQGAKKYAITKCIDKSKIDDNMNVVEIKKDKAVILEITVAGVPKSGAKALKRLEDFKDNFVFDFKYTGKNLLIYNDEQEEFELIDYKGKKSKVKDKHGVCLVPTTYTLSKALEYANLISDNSSKRAVFKE